LIKNYQWGTIVAVSDGLGSKRHSDIGSKAACKAVVQAVKKTRLKDGALEVSDFFSLIQKNWIALIEPYASKDCSATCLFAYITEEKILAVRLGDGLIGILGEKETDTKFLVDSKEDDFLNATQSLSDKNLKDEWQYIQVATPDYSAVLLCTDGISSDLEEGKELDFCKELYRNSVTHSCKENSAEARAFLKNWPVKGHSDDKTIIMVEIQ
jgi:serine/threonine protein phosphatase PrpC